MNNKRLEVDLADLADIMEGFVKKLDSLTEPDQIDLAARLKPVAKACKTIDDRVKDQIKTNAQEVAGWATSSKRAKAGANYTPRSVRDQRK
jgi:hypothetical protein